jgi:archaellum biogenesis ATPase FlaH
MKEQLTLKKSIRIYQTAMRQRLIDDIDSNDVTGYTQSLLSQILNLMILMDLDVILVDNLNQLINLDLYSQNLKTF